MSPGPVCFGCGAAVRKTNHYLCAGCWARLPEQTRRRLYLRDPQARARVVQLYSALRRAVPLEQIEVSA